MTSNWTLNVATVALLCAVAGPIRAGQPVDRAACDVLIAQGKQDYQRSVQIEWSVEHNKVVPGGYGVSLQVADQVYTELLNALSPDDLSAIRGVAAWRTVAHPAIERLKEVARRVIGIHLEDPYVAKMGIHRDLEDPDLWAEAAAKQTAFSEVDGRIYVSWWDLEGVWVPLTGDVDADRAEAARIFGRELARHVYEVLDHPKSSADQTYHSERDYLERGLRIPSFCFEQNSTRLQAVAEGSDVSVLPEMNNRTAHVLGPSVARGAY
jgi:hypothetical protein